MTNQMQITSETEFQEIINSLEKSYNNILSIFEMQKRNAENINETDTWTGATARVMYGKYKMLNNNYNHIEYSLDLYIKFLKKTLSDYKLLIEKMNANLDSSQQSLDVVS